MFESKPGKGNGRIVELPLWMVRVAEYLLALLLLGAVGTCLIILYWVASLSVGQDHIERQIKKLRNEIKQEQVETPSAPSASE